jgi:UDP-galactopyranose mutase
LADTKAGNVIFGGRLGQYRYYNMDQVIGAALVTVEKELK